jgi:hypothetical protein
MFIVCVASGISETERHNYWRFKIGLGGKKPILLYDCFHSPRQVPPEKVSAIVTRTIHHKFTELIAFSTT